MVGTIKRNPFFILAGFVHRQYSLVYKFGILLTVAKS